MTATVDLRLGDAVEVMRTLPAGSVDAVITDPPYPNFHAERYKYKDGLIDFLNCLTCRQFVFWTIKDGFPLSFTARHIWHKQTGTYATEEYIYERNGQSIGKRFSYQKIKNRVDAQMNRDVLTVHPSQKPIRLILSLMQMVKADTILDPFMGSGTTGVACVKLNRNFIGCEIDPTYFAIAKKRIADAQQQMVMPL